MQIILATPRGFCAGANAPLPLLNAPLKNSVLRSTFATKSLYNKFVCDDLRAKGSHIHG